VRCPSGSQTPSQAPGTWMFLQQNQRRFGGQVSFRSAPLHCIFHSVGDPTALRAYSDFRRLLSTTTDEESRCSMKWQCSVRMLVKSSTLGLSTALLGCHGIALHQNSSHCGLSTVSNGEAKIADSIPHVRENVPLPFPFQCHHHRGIHVVACRRLLLECFLLSL